MAENIEIGDMVQWPDGGVRAVENIDEKGMAVWYNALGEEIKATINTLVLVGKGGES